MSNNQKLNIESSIINYKKQPNEKYYFNFNIESIIKGKNAKRNFLRREKKRKQKQIVNESLLVEKLREEEKEKSEQKKDKKEE